jgi:hypothetical protein
VRFVILGKLVSIRDMHFERDEILTLVQPTHWHGRKGPLEWIQASSLAYRRVASLPIRSQDFLGIWLGFLRNAYKSCANDAYLLLVSPMI